MLFDFRVQCSRLLSKKMTAVLEMLLLSVIIASYLVLCVSYHPFGIRTLKKAKADSICMNFQNVVDVVKVKVIQTQSHVVFTPANLLPIQSTYVGFAEWNANSKDSKF